MKFLQKLPRRPLEAYCELKVINQRSRSHVFLYVFCVQDAAATRGQYLALSKLHVHACTTRMRTVSYNNLALFLWRSRRYRVRCAWKCLIRRPWGCRCRAATVATPGERRCWLPHCHDWTTSRECPETCCRIPSGMPRSTDSQTVRS